MIGSAIERRRPAVFATAVLALTVGAASAQTDTAPADGSSPPVAVGAPRQLVPNLPNASGGETGDRGVGPDGVLSIPSPGTTPGVEALGETEASSGLVELSEEERAVTVDGRASVAGVVAEELTGFDSEVIGLAPSETDSPLDREMFGRATRNDLRDLLAALPTAGATPAMRRLMRTVLVTATLPLPGGPGRDAGEPTLLGLRLAKLGALGYGDDLERLAAEFPAIFDDPFAVRAWADGLVLLDRLTPVCAHATGLLGTPLAGEPYWQQVQILCDLSTDNPHRASLILQVLQESGRGDSRFAALADRVLDPPADLSAEARSGEPSATDSAPDDATGDPSGEPEGEDDAGVVPLPEPEPPAPLPPMALPAEPVAVAMHLLAESPLPMGIRSDASPALMETVAYAEASPAALRLQAAEAATAAGLMSPFTLNQFQLSVPLPEAAIADPIAFAGGRDTAVARAALVQGALEAEYASPAEGEPATAPRDRALAMRHYAILRAVATREPLPVVAGLLQGLNPSADHLPVAEAAAATFYALDDPTLAEGWIALLEATVAEEAEAAAAAAEAAQAAETASTEGDADPSEPAAADGLTEAASGEVPTEGEETAPDAAEPANGADAVDRGPADEAAAPPIPTATVDPGILDRLWPLRFLATAETSGTLADMGYAAGMNAWLTALLEGDGTEAADYGAAVTLAVLDALGHDVDDAVWSRLSLDDVRTAVQLPSAPLWWRLPRAAASGQAGLAALMAIIVLGDNGVAAVHPVVIAHVVESLTQAGLVEEARGLALEAVWAALP